MKNNYYLGLDIGTESVGWAVADDQYRLLKRKGTDLWGVRLFESGKPALERRIFRTARRRNDRKKQRINLLQEYFASEICAVDGGFFQRLKESFYSKEDKECTQANTLFNDRAFADQDYHNRFPTIYHLRRSLIKDTTKKPDIRLVYLAIAHILKKRGHFLFEGQELNVADSFKNLYADFVECLLSALDNVDMECVNMRDLEALMREKQGLNAKKEKLTELLGKGSKQKQAWITLLCGGKVKLSDLFLDDTLKEAEKPDIEFKGSSYEENMPAYTAALGEKMQCIEYANTVYGWSVLANILGDSSSISEAKIASYEKHEKDLKLLKELLCENHAAYCLVFKDKTNASNYVAYIGKSMLKANKSSCAQEDFYGFLKKTLASAPEDAPHKAYIFEEIEKGDFLPKQTTGDNGVIPYQLHLKELKAILENASRYYDFLSQKDESGLTVNEKIQQIMTFRIPYYIGPLNDAHQNDKAHSHSWIVKKAQGKIYPWNFEEKVDLDATAEKFITRMTNRCTYLKEADVLPQNSILYSKFMVLNEINNLKINGEKISVEQKQQLYEMLYLRRKKVTTKVLRKYIISQGWMDENSELTGIDIELKSSMASWYDLQQILGEEIADIALCEDVIKTLTLFGEDKHLVINRLRNHHPQRFSDAQLKKIVSLKFAGWGRLSYEFLMLEALDTSTGELVPLISKMYDTNENLMQLLGNDYQYHKAIEDYNAKQGAGSVPFTYEALVEPLYCSPAVKRSIWQTLSVVKEVCKIMGGEPRKIFVEMAREDGEKKRTISRKNALLALYKKCKDSTRDWAGELGAKTESDLRSDKLYLYYTQMGRCMYSGEEISLQDLYNNNLYDIDHIYPQSKTKDDSINNRVLVKKNLNKDKGDSYPIPQSMRTPKTLELWSRLYKMELISKIKYDRLIRTDHFSEDELAGFINRQLVETRQSTKAVAQTLQSVFAESRIVYSKAGLVSDFRQQFDFVKVRDINDYHHAKDAYLNIVVGNVYDTKFTANPRVFLSEKQSYNLRRMYEFEVKRSSSVAWEPGDAGSIGIVRNTMNKNRMFFTKYAYEMTGGFSNQQPLKAGYGQMQLKTENPKLTTQKYGGYNSESTAYFMLVRHNKKNKMVKSIVHVPIRLAKQIESGALSLENYCKTQLKLCEAEILIPKIKKFTLFYINGFPMHITGRTGNRFIFAPAVQLCVEDNVEKYLKKIVKFYERNRIAKGIDCMVDAWSGITAEDNMLVYDMMISKLEHSIFSLRPNFQLKLFQDGKAIFANLSLEQQAIALYKTLAYFKCAAESVDMELIGGKKRGGIITLGSTFSPDDLVKIVYPSPTGFFTNEVDVQKL